ncbi:cilia- and flagella-associated protein 97-like [Limulus polyphemus]|uniref:Cilia- and flagella-associated protein 97-like n=1 Tax=Limulus polyphemus TaxID=6850 RepID=A0ABM1TNR3_LIMPO|nr:cilia- and flagella-associated protein 97-like [Limulus polyphemus]
MTSCLNVGLGDCQDDLDIKGEIDFDFFDAPEKSKCKSWEANPNSESGRPQTLEIEHCLLSHSNHELPGEKSIVAEAQIEINPSYWECDSPSLNYNESVEAVPKDASGYFPSHSQACGCNVLTCPIFSTSEDLDASGSLRRKKVIETTIPCPCEDVCSNVQQNSDLCTAAARIGCELCVCISPHKCVSNDTKDKSKYENTDKTDRASPTSSLSTSDSDDLTSEDSLDGLSESDSITDVTPLSSPYWCDSPLPQCKSFKRLPCETNESEQNNKESCREGASNEQVIKKQENVKFSESAYWQSENFQELDELNQVVEALQALETRSRNERTNIKQRNCVTPPVLKGRKNMSFSNQQVHQIDQENQRLLRKILAQQNRSKAQCGSDSRPPCTASSAINRRRQQRQIENDNLMLLKRLESAKPSTHLSRTNLLRDYNKYSRVTSRSSFRSHSSGPSSQQSSARLSSSSSSLSSLQSSDSSCSSPKASKSVNNRPKSAKHNPISQVNHVKHSSY